MLQEKLAADLSAVPVYRIDLAGSYVNYGRLLDGLGESATALDWYARAIPVLEDSAHPGFSCRHRPEIPRYRVLEAGRGASCDSLANAEALTDWDRALALDDGSNRPMYRQQRALTLARTGDPVRAVAEAEDLTQGDQVSGGTLYDAACICALSSASVSDDAKRQDSYAGRAVAILRRARRQATSKTASACNI